MHLGLGAKQITPTLPSLTAYSTLTEGRVVKFGPLEWPPQLTATKNFLDLG